MLPNSIIILEEVKILKARILLFAMLFMKS